MMKLILRNQLHIMRALEVLLGQGDYRRVSSRETPEGAMRWELADRVRATREELRDR